MGEHSRDKLDPRKVDPETLAPLMELAPVESRAWSRDELAAVLQHQLAAPVRVDLAGLDADEARKLLGLSESQGLMLKSYRDMLGHAQPPVELLEMTKRFAKASAAHPDGPLPREVGMYLYFASIIVAMTRLGRRISHLDDQAIHEGADWLLHQPWIGQDERALLEEGLEHLDQQPVGTA